MTDYEWENAAAKGDAAAAADPTGRIAAIRAANRSFIDRHPFGELRKAVAARRMKALKNAAAGAALVAALAILPSRLAQIGGDPAGDVRVKGGLELTAFVKAADAPKPYDGRDELREGDEIRLAYSAPAGAYAAIVSFDGRGVATPHLPRDGADAVRTEEAGMRALPYAYRLDDAPAFEDIYLFSSDSPFRVPDAGALGSLGAADDGILPGGVRWLRIRIRKSEEPR